ncbi:MAG: AAA family ATPase [Deltaproteobacteria bacterium]|jgi:hypothetical protein|nr:AAA family ATPase [Deltaproteobacteria bacterium]
MTLKQLPLDDQSFAEIIDDNLLYADKTRYIYELLRGSRKKSYFLSRPRRFGKTILLDTLEELFTGNRERFKGLWIERSDYDFPKIPVLSLTLSFRSDSPEILENNIIEELKKITEEAKPSHKVSGATSDMYLDSLIRALYQESQSKIAVLIDEYDAPVTRNMDNLEIATANAKILHDFFATLKKRPVSRRVRFTLVTGITRYALASMDSGPNHLNDISMDPRFAGLCGFTLEELDYLFADRWELTLAKLKNSGEMGPSDSLKDLRAEILDWYDGYNWGGENRVLNPYSILHFFNSNSFDGYWMDSGRPGHLTALIKKRPLDFLQPNLDSIISSELRKSDLNKLAASSVLFHSGYLTMDKVKIVKVKVKGMTKTDKLYSFRLPNHEVTRGYYPDYFSVILNLQSPNELQAKAEILQQAFLAKDAEKVSSMFRDFISSFTYYQKPKDERDFHLIVQAILMGMDFKVLSEVPSSKGRSDISVELPGRVYLIIELKYRSNPNRNRTEKENAALASLAYELLSIGEVFEYLAKLASDIDDDELVKISPELSKKGLTRTKRRQLLGKAAKKLLPKSVINESLASLVLEKLPPEELNQELRNLGVEMNLSSDSMDLAVGRIDQVLTKTAQLALRYITQKDYHGPFRLEAKEFIDLALVIYDQGSHVKALFNAGSQGPSAETKKTRLLIDGLA